jgi:hypothetical protein
MRGKVELSIVLTMVKVMPPVVQTVKQIVAIPKMTFP